MSDVSRLSHVMRSIFADGHVRHSELVRLRQKVLAVSAKHPDIAQGLIAQAVKHRLEQGDSIAYIMGMDFKRLAGEARNLNAGHEQAS